MSPVGTKPSCEKLRRPDDRERKHGRRDRALYGRLGCTRCHENGPNAVGPAGAFVPGEIVNRSHSIGSVLPCTTTRWKFDTFGVSRTRFFRFSLMVIQAETNTAPRRSSMTWSALKGERLILQAPPAPLRQLIDEHLAQAGVDARSAMVLNRLDTLIAMVETGEGIGIVRPQRCRYAATGM